MRYFIAILHTVLLVLIPLIMVPTLQWYKRTFLEPNTDIWGVYVLLILISLGMFIMTIIRWAVALQNDKDNLDLL
jgi:hypothetical protein